MGFYIESAKQMINPIDVPTFMIECAETERKLFEGLIELDFAEVYKESGLAVFTEEETAEADKAASKAIGERINGIIDKCKKTLAGLLETVTTKLKEFFDKTADLLTKKVLDNPKAKECPTEVVWYEDYQAEAKKVLNISDLDNILNGIQASNILDAENEHSDKLKGYYDKFTADLAKLPTTAEAAKAEGSPISAKKIGDQNIASLKSALSVGGIGSDIKKIYDSIANDSVFDTLKIKEDDTEAVKTAKGKTATQVTKVKVAFFSAMVKATLETAKIARSNFVTLAQFVKADGKKEATGESANIYVAMSDMLCESIFGI